MSALIARDSVRLFEAFRADLIASLAFTWSCDDPCEPVEHHLVIGAAPSPTKDALAMGLLSGELKHEGPSLVGTLELTALGRLVVRRFRLRTRWVL